MVKHKIFLQKKLFNCYEFKHWPEEYSPIQDDRLNHSKTMPEIITRILWHQKNKEKWTINEMPLVYQSESVLELILE